MPKKILIVDDEPGVLNALESRLFFAEYDVLRATSGEEAVKIALKEGPDLIVMDVLMPGMDGIQASVELLKDARTKEIPVIFLTALQSKREQDDILEKHGGVAKANMTFAKPFDSRQLMACIRQILDGKENDG